MGRGAEADMGGGLRVAVVGSGVSGLAAAWRLVQAGQRVVLFEKDAHVGGHAHTMLVGSTPVDVGFMVFNLVTYPHMVAWFEEQGVGIEASDMSFAVSLKGGRGCEWGSNGLNALFCQRSNALNPHFLRMLREMVSFEGDVLRYLEEVESGDASEAMGETLGHFLDSRGYSDKFRTCYLVPVCAAIWSCSSESVLAGSAVCILQFLRNHHMLQLFNRPQWYTVAGRSQTYVAKMVEAIEGKGSDVRTNCKVVSVTSTANGVLVEDSAGQVEHFDRCIVAAHAPDALSMLGDSATLAERQLLGACQYNTSEIYLHRDESLMPQRKAAWSAWNFLGSEGGRICVTYWLNRLQNLGDTGAPILVTLNPEVAPSGVVAKWSTGHPIPSTAAHAAAKRFHTIQGTRGLWFCGAYQGYGFHEDGFRAGMGAAQDLLGAAFTVSPYPRQFTASWLETVARSAVLAFLRDFIKVGTLELFELGGTVLSFGEAKDEKAKGGLNCRLRIKSPAFYWKVATRADLGIADAYIDGDFTCVGDVLDLLLVLIANRDRKRTPGAAPQGSKRGWWTPALLTAAWGHASAYVQHLLKKNTLTNARRNIAAHYDLSNEMFGLFLDETMTYSCAIFKTPDEPLKDAQLRKLHALIDKARVGPGDHVLEIGFGWGSMAMELVRRTGCRYTGITLSQQQLALATQRVRQAGLQDRIQFQLCDYRALPGLGAYDRIISCEMLEAVGHEYYPDFFHHCDRLLAPNGVMVVQVITTPEERYEEYRQSSDFIKEYIFPGCCCPSFAALTSAMAQSSSLCVEEVVNIGPHYAPTLLRWRDNFNAHHSELLAMGFGDKFLRMWDYYFAYCAAGFQTRTIGDIQVVFSRPGNVSSLGSL